MFNRALLSLALGVMLLAACSKQTAVTPVAEPARPDATAGEDAEREQLSAAACESRGGAVVGDIGDGAIHRPDYRCENGEAPIGTIQPEGDEPIATEGAVCCSITP